MKEKVVKQQYYVRNGGSGYNRSFCMSEGLYDASYEHDACGVGMIVNIHGIKSHALVDSALTVLEHMKHRGAEGAGCCETVCPFCVLSFRSESAGPLSSALFPNKS